MNKRTPFSPSFSLVLFFVVFLLNSVCGPVFSNKTAKKESVSNTANSKAAHSKAPAANSNSIWQKLQQGGYVILMRHALTERKGNPMLAGTASCKGQRLLSATGRQQARSIGNHFRRYKIPLDRIFTSQYCRTHETGKIAFGRATVLPALNLIPAQSESQNEKNIATIKKMIKTHQGKKNLVLISHRPNIETLTFEEVPKGGFLVLKPDRSGFELIKQIVIKP